MVRASVLPIDRAYYDAHSTPIPTPAYSFRDLYAALIFALVLLLGLPVLLLQFVFSVVPVWMIAAWSVCLRQPLETVPRDCGFHLASALLFVVGLPSMATCFLWTWTLRLVAMLTCLPIGLLLCNNPCKAYKALAPFSGRPGEGVVGPDGQPRSVMERLAPDYGSWFGFQDVVACVIGGMHRQGNCEFFAAWVMMLWLVPAYKTLVLNNFWLFPLEEVFINQWSDPIDADADGEVDSEDQLHIRRSLRNQICRAKLRERNRALTDAWPFAGHYPYPPPARASRTAAGLQFSDGTVLSTMLTHTGHPSDVTDPTVRNIAGFEPRSAEALFGVSCVYLQSWNALHVYTGYVEVNVRKDGGCEHPMWLVSAARTSRLHANSISGVNKLFVRLGVRFRAYTANDPEVKAGLRRFRAGGETGAARTIVPAAVVNDV